MKLNATGVIYDESEMDRVNAMIQAQQKEFIASEKDKSTKEWIFIGTIAVVSAVTLILIVNRYAK